MCFACGGYVSGYVLCVFSLGFLCVYFMSVFLYVCVFFLVCVLCVFALCACVFWGCVLCFHSRHNGKTTSERCPPFLAKRP